MRERERTGVGGGKVKGEIDRDRMKERKERMLHYGRGSSLLESVCLFSGQEKSYW